MRSEQDLIHSKSINSDSYDVALSLRTIFEELSDFIPLKSRSSMDWARNAISDFNAFLVDHAACERKASSTCMAFVVKYGDKPDFVDAMITLAREELEHFHQAFRLMRERGLQFSNDEKDPYVNQLLAMCRSEKDQRFLDRMLAFSIIEARGCERFGLVGEALIERGEQELGKYYVELARSEARHFGLFLKFSEKFFSKETSQKRLDELLEAEAAIVAALPWRCALH